MPVGGIGLNLVEWYIQLSTAPMGGLMYQSVTINWHPIEFGEMPEHGTYLVAWDDGTVESYPFDDRDIQDGEIRSGSTKGLYWADPLPHPHEV